MEECGVQGLKPGQASNNPPFDLGPAKYIFSKLPGYAKILGVDRYGCGGCLNALRRTKCHLVSHEFGPNARNWDPQKRVTS